MVSVIKEPPEIVWGEAERATGGIVGQAGAGEGIIEPAGDEVAPTTTSVLIAMSGWLRGTRTNSQAPSSEMAPRAGT